MSDQNNMESVETQSNEAKTEATMDARHSPSKLFTQAEVNTIIGDRLQRVRKQCKAEFEAELQERIAELETREAAIVQRENTVACREYLIEKGYPAELLEIIDTNNVEDFKGKADKAQAIVGSRPNKYPSVLDAGEVLHIPSASNRSAFDKVKHTPKQFPPR